MGTKKTYSLDEVSEMFEKKGVKIEKKPIEKMTKPELIKEVKMLEKLLELNMEDLWAIVGQRDKLYAELESLKGHKQAVAQPLD